MQPHDLRNEELKYLRSLFRASANGDCIVLIVTDKLAELQNWSSTLKERFPHYTILEATTVERGLGLWRDQKVDCVIVDLDMPDESGFKLLFTLNPDPKRPTIAVVTLTRVPHRHLHDLLLRHGTQAVLVKNRTSSEDWTRAIHSAMAAAAATNRDLPRKVDCILLP